MLVKLFSRRLFLAVFVTLVFIFSGFFFALNLDRSGKTAATEALVPAATATVSPLPATHKESKAIPVGAVANPSKINQPVDSHPSKADKHGTAQTSADQTGVLGQGLNHLTLANVPLTVFVPASLKPSEPAQLLMAFHGMGGNGQDMCDKMITFAEQNNVVVIAPTFSYNPDYTNIDVIRTEDIQITASINEIVTDFEQTSHIQLKDHYLLYGFSRGAQIAHRFATLYPERVLGVAVLAAGTYTLPFSNNPATNAPLPWPYGVADLQTYTGKQFDETDFLKLHFWLEVGDQDTDPKGISRAWDKLLGTTRLERSKNYYQALKQAGVDVHWNLIPNTGHSENGTMRAPVLNYFSRLLNHSGDAAKPAPTKVGAIYFVDTGHNLSGVFRSYWETHGGLAQFGYPITEEFSELNIEDNQSYTVQYFERARFEYHPEFSGTKYEVELGLLGKQFAPEVTPQAKGARPVDSLYFSETGHSLSGAFQKYWLAHGGLAMYGYPITEPFEEKNLDDGRVYQVQYFERNRFEYHPEFAGTTNEVLLGLLGKLAYRLNYL